MGLIAAGKTDIGRKRKTNQDAIFVGHKKNLFVVADGMGGHNGGDIASAMAVKLIPEYFDQNPNSNPDENSKKAVLYANQNIKNHALTDPNLQGMGTTVNMLKFKGDTLYIGNVGDSRTYLINKQKIYQLSKDHSLVQEKLNLGIYNREMAQKDPEKNVLVRAVGFDDEVEVDIFTYKVSRGDIFLSCSDGLHGKVSDADILFLINHHIPDPSKATKEKLEMVADTLVAQANENGGQDNISVILVIAL